MYKMPEEERKIEDLRMDTRIILKFMINRVREYRLDSHC
jgi:hypothetical protein